MSLSSFAQFQVDQLMPCKTEACNFLNLQHHVLFLLPSSCKAGYFFLRAPVPWLLLLFFFFFLLPDPRLEVPGGHEQQWPVSSLSE